LRNQFENFFLTRSQTSCFSCRATLPTRFRTM
jgi:hypothetical protein